MTVWPQRNYCERSRIRCHYRSSKCGLQAITTKLSVRISSSNFVSLGSRSDVRYDWKCFRIDARLAMTPPPGHLEPIVINVHSGPKGVMSH